MRQAKEQDIGRAMDIEVIHDPDDAFDVRRNPALNLAEKVHPVDNGPPAIRLGQRFAILWSERPKDIPLSATPVINLDGYTESLLRIRRWMHDVGAFEGLRALWAHLIATDYDTARRWRRVERDDGPLFSAKSGSTRSVNQISCILQRNPSCIRSSSMRERFIPMFFCSLR